MAVSLKHKFTSAKTDDVDTSLVRPSNWNDEHDLTIATARLVGRTTAETGTIEEISVSSDLSLSAGTLGVASSVVTLTGTQTLTNKTITTVAGFETKVAIAALNIDLSLGNYFSKTISGASTLTVSSIPASGITASFILDLTNGGAGAITWWSGTKWAAGTAPTLTAAGRDVLGFFTHDGGTTWTGLVLGKDVK